VLFNWSRKSSNRRQGSETKARRGKRLHGGTFAKPWVEVLEDRVVLSQVFWTNPAGGDWSVASNWSTGQLPGAGDDVVINTPGITITHSGGTDSVNSITSQDPIVLSGGTLSVAGNSTLSSLTMTGGTLTGAGTVTVTGQTTWTGGTMSGSGTTVAQGGMALSGGSLDGRTLNNYGAAALAGAGAGVGMLGTVNMSNGIATLVVSTLARGKHSITAVYSSDADFLASTSAVLTQTVN
jgi:hypothetical protein